MENTQKTTCSLFQDKFFELLIEPETAPKDLQQEWQQHLLQCEPCQQQFAAIEQQQSAAQNLVQQLESNIEIPCFFPEARAHRWNRRWPIYIMKVAALVLVAISIGFLAGRGSRKLSQERYAKSLDAKVEKVLRLSQSHDMDERKFAALLQNTVVHLTKIRKEFVTIGNIAVQYRTPQAPLFPLRLKFYSRLFLMKTENLEKMQYLKSTNYELAETKKLFDSQIKRISGDKKLQDNALSFFQQAAPHMFKVLDYKNTLWQEMTEGMNEESRLNPEFLTLLENLENLTSDF